MFLRNFFKLSPLKYIYRYYWIRNIIYNHSHMQYHPPFLYHMFSFVMIRLYNPLYNFLLPSDENHLIIPLNQTICSLPNCITLPPPPPRRFNLSRMMLPLQFETSIPSFFHARCWRIYVAGMYASVIELNVSASATSSLRRYALLIATRSYEDYN